MRTFVIVCSACKKEERRQETAHFTYDDLVDELKDVGWMRRSFNSYSWNEGSWFCCEHCAFDSEYAIQCEELQQEREERKNQEEFEEYCRGGNSSNRFIFALALFALLVAYLSIRGYLHVS